MSSNTTMIPVASDTLVSTTEVFIGKVRSDQATLIRLSDEDLLLYVNYKWVIKEHREVYSKRLSGEWSLAEAQKRLRDPEGIGFSIDREPKYEKIGSTWNPSFVVAMKVWKDE